MKIEKLKVKAFRGFVNKENEFEFAPITIFYGPNGTGKSSTLNAIEWCFYGNECTGRATGIRERIDWELKNRNASEAPSVEIETSIGKIVKSLEKGSREKSQLDPEVEAILNKYSFKDFLTGVYQHQEVIRAILVEEPKVRNEGFDRLLGLSEYRNIVQVINDIIRKTKSDNLEVKMTPIKDKIAAKVEEWEKMIKIKREDIINKGIKEEDISDEKEGDIKDEIKKELEEFMKELGINPTNEFMQLNKNTETEMFNRIVKNEVTKCRSEMPEMKKQKELGGKQSILNTLLGGYENLLKNLNEKRSRLTEFISKNGDKEKLEIKKNEINGEIEKINREKEERSLQGSIIKKAIEFLEQEGINKNLCPVCGKETADLLGHLKREYEEKYESILKGLEGQLKEKEMEKEEIERLIKESDNLQGELKSSQESLKKKISEISKEINREIKVDEDPKAILNSRISEIQNELEQLRGRNKKKDQKLMDIEEKLPVLEKITEILKYQRYRDEARIIESTDEWKKLEEVSNNFKKLMENLENIISAIQKASEEEAESKIRSAQDKIDEYFKAITNHSSVQKIDLQVKKDPRTHWNNYKLLDQNREEIIPILSQGNLNALALSIFLALSENLPFEFIMLDDPSQSLSSEEKERLVEKLNEVSKKKNIIISTMDNELYKFLKEKLTKQKKIYEFGPYNPQEGPLVNEVQI
ncbi:MAG: AAA family ATPase [Candidatus Omnitrophica bacterium]|nr:AAA family ATPase [Candidatus Omnitrophota bacterium]